jgi:hypothetical protein
MLVSACATAIIVALRAVCFLLLEGGLLLEHRTAWKVFSKSST